MHIHLVNPSDLAFGTAVITPRWLYVLAAATPERFRAPSIIDETLEPFDAATQILEDRGLKDVDPKRKAKLAELMKAFTDGVSASGTGRRRRGR